MGRRTSTALSVSTGSPQGCVLSRVLYALWTHDCTPAHQSNTIVKFADDTMVVGLISRGMSWLIRKRWSGCPDGVRRTTFSTPQSHKELIIAYRMKKTDISPLYISGDFAKRVADFRFL